ncbi:MAG: ATP-grasp domain-containing protein [Fimbriimonadaceae bacterium]|nr:ATP-grasp domain-containing protein [Fimbriimonadaceae bacterium]QYK56908.1 MAG: ATP-grasp domain-containing protein [Fimbriimonadaceae bacterium]
MAFDYDLGLLGGGQLARMTIMAAQRMGLRCLSLDPGRGTPAGHVADSIEGPLDDAEAIAEVCRRCHSVTLENEFIPADVLEAGVLAAGRAATAVTPGWQTLGWINDKLRQRERLAAASVPSPHAIALTSAADASAFTTPYVIKARFGGYDGKGTRTVRSEADLHAFTDFWQGGGWLAEEYVPFRRELAVMVYRSPSETGTFPTMVTEQVDHVCDVVYPADVEASEIAIAAVEAVEGFGLFGVELFELEDGSFQVNEIAPRPHNTGHYTLDWGGVSQFEQHVRLAMGAPCVEPEGQLAAMANILGQGTPGEGSGDWRPAMRAMLEAVPEARFHWYGKGESRPGRKMGHINAVGPGAVETVRRARGHFYRSWRS